MKIRGKLLSLVIGGVVVVGSVIAVYSIITEKKMGRERIENIEKTLIAQRKTMLSNLVDNAYVFTEASYKQSQDISKLAEMYQKKLSELVSVVHHSVETVYNMKDISDEQKQIMAMQIVKEMRYDTDQYFWINDMEGKMLMHPIKPSLDGTDMMDFKDASGKTFFKDMVEVCKTDGQGMINYMWPKPGSDEPVKKVSYVKLFEPWNWIIGTGVYMESSEEEMKKNSLDTINSIRFEDDESGYFFVLSLKNRTVVQHPKAALIGTSAEDPIYTDSTGKKILVEQLSVVEKDGKGYMSYFWSKPGSEEPVEKMVYIKYFKEWDWVIGTGVYVDDIAREVQAEAETVKAEINSQIRNTIFITLVVCALVSVIAVLTANKLTRPIIDASEMLEDIAQCQGESDQKACR